MWVEILGAVIAFYLLLKFVIYPQNTPNKPVSNEKKIPGMDPSHPEEGNKPDINKEKTLSIFLHKLHEKYGPIASFWEGKKMAISIATPELFKEIRSMISTPKDMFPEFEITSGPELFLYASTEEILRRRKIYDHHFMMTACKSYTASFHEIAQETIKKWKNLSANEDVPLLATMGSVSLLALTRTSFGDFFKEERNMLAYERMFNYIAKYIGALPPTDSKEFKTLKENCNEINSMAKRAIDERKITKGKDDTRLFIDLLIDDDLTENAQIEDCKLFIAAGHLPTTITMTWCIYEMAKQVTIQEKLYQEIIDVLGDKPLTTEDMPRLTYLRKVIDETLRIYFRNSYGIRESDMDMKIGGYDIRKGTSVYQATGSVAMDPKIWPNPYKFDPERFSPANNKTRHAFAFKPFGFAGKRVCPGQSFAYTEISVFFSEWIRHFRFRLVEGQNIRPMETILMLPEEEIKIRLECRDRK